MALEPVLVEGLRGNRAVLVSAGRGHLATVTEAGDVMCLGVGTDGRLGNGTDCDSFEMCRAGARDRHDGWDEESAVMVACGYFHTAATTRSGTCYLWGFGGRGQLGAGDLESRALPTPVPAHHFNGESVRFVACGLMQTLAVTCNGRLFSWGGGECGQLGLGDVEDRLHPCLVSMPPEDGDAAQGPQQPVSAACAGSYLSAVITASGCLYTFGLGDDGQLGQGDVKLCSMPGRVQGLPSVCQAAAGGAHMACVTRDGQLFTWGNGKHGQLGLGPRALSCSVPWMVGGELSSKIVVASSCGLDHTAALSAEGQIYTWGMSRGGRLGRAQAQAPVSSSSVEVWVNCFEPAHVRVARSREGGHPEQGEMHAECDDQGAPALHTKEVRHDSEGGDCRPSAEQERLGRCRELPPELCCALAMGVHESLGAVSGLQVLPAEMIERFAEAAAPWPCAWRCGAVSAGVVGLMGGGVEEPTSSPAPSPRGEVGPG